MIHNRLKYNLRYSGTRKRLYSTNSAKECRFPANMRNPGISFNTFFGESHKPKNQVVMYYSKLPIIGASKAQVQFLQKIAWEYGEITSLSNLADLENLLAPEEISMVFYCGNFTGHHTSTQLHQLLQQEPQLPVVWMPEQADARAVVEAFHLGVVDVLLDPIPKERLLQCLKKNARPVVNIKDKPAPSEFDFTRPFWKWLFPLLSDQMGIVPWYLADPDSSHALTMGADFNVQFFGTFQFFHKDRPFSNDLNRLSKAILAYLILYRHNPPIRAKIISKFWPYTSNEAAKNSLCVAIHNIRKWFRQNGLGDDCLLFKKEKYIFSSDFNIDTDVDHFQRNWQLGKQAERSGNLEDAFFHYHRAFGFYRGDFMEDLENVEWIESTRENLQDTYVRLLDRIGLFFLEKGDYEVCIKISNKILDIAPFLEEAHRRLMLCYCRMGQRGKAIQQFQKCKELLRTELRLSPAQQTIQLYEQITDRQWV